MINLSISYPEFVLSLRQMFCLYSHKLDVLSLT